MMKKTETKIELPRINIELLEIPIIGDTPLIVHAWSLKAKRMMLDKQTKKAVSGREAKNPKQDFEDSQYRFPDGGFGFPSVAFKSAAVTACTSTGAISKVAARQSFQVIGESIDIRGAFEGTEMRADLVRIMGSKPTMREDMVKIGLGTADLRYRAEFFPWYAKILVRYNANVLSASQILNLFNTAGFAVGVGEWRAERDGQNGAFHVAESHELKNMIVKAVKSKPSKKAA